MNPESLPSTGNGTGVAPDPEAAEFIRFALQTGVLRFGEFRTKAGRLSPYFYNSGLFNDGASLGTLADFYAARIRRAERSGELQFDMLFGPAYKGITLAATTAVSLARAGRSVPFAFNRKEAKAHGEGGSLIGAPLAGRVLIIDDVISAGTSVRESVELIRSQGATPAAVIIGLDRMEVGGTAQEPAAHSAVQEVRALYDIPVLAIATLDDVFHHLELQLGQAAGARDDTSPEAVHLQRISDYRARYGVAERG